MNEIRVLKIIGKRIVTEAWEWFFGGSCSKEYFNAIVF